MSPHRPFRPSDFSIHDVPTLIAAYVSVSLAATAAGMFLEQMPRFWAGVLCGLGVGLLVGLGLLRGNLIDVSKLPPPSLAVRRLCDDPA